MTHSQSSDAWRQYKATWLEIPELKSLERAEVVAAQVGDLASGLARAFPSRPELCADLAAALDDRARWRVEALRPPPRGKLPRPDWTVELSQATEVLEHLVAALGGLRDAGVTDAWIATGLVPEVKLFREAVKSHLRRVSAEPGGAETSNVVDRARSASKAAAAALSLPGR